MEVITAGIPEMDDCPILTRINAFIVHQGVVCTLQHIVRDRNGNPLDLSSYLLDSDSASNSTSENNPGGTAVVRIKDFLGAGNSASVNPIWELEATSADPVSGVLTADLISTIVDKSGIYELCWGIKDADGTLVIVSNGLMSVERTLFAISNTTVRKNLGPPTINEIRMWMMDSSPNENLLLDSVEFSDEQICLALTRPVLKWNESLPPIGTYTTRNFPFRGAWATGTLAELYKIAGSHYRRNRLGSSAGGITIDDKNKEREYMAEGLRLQAEYDAWMQDKKVSINMKLFAGEHISAYSSRNGW